MDIFDLIRSNNFEGIRAWINDKNTNKDVVDARGETPLHHAISHLNYIAAEIFIKNDLYIQRSVNYNKCTPLHLAAIFGLANLVSLLIERDAPVNIGDKFGRSPLHCAARCDGNNNTVVILIENGAKINAFDINGCTPLIDAICWSETIETAKTLLNEGASLLTHENPVSDYLCSTADEEFILLMKRNLKLQKFISCRKKLHMSSGVFLKFLNTFKFSFSN